MQLPRPPATAPPFDILVGKNTPPARDLRISVILPFHDPRGHPEHLAGWTREQTLAGEQFEVIAVTNTLDAELQRKIRDHLRPQDLVVHSDVRDHFALYAIGANVARAPLLFFSEDHCRADAGCLEGVAGHFSNPDATAATVRWGDINLTDVSLMEALACQVAAREWFKPGHWDRLRIRGIAIRRDVYHQTGGFELAYHGFSEAVMSAKIHAMGISTGHIKESGIRHINTETLQQIRQSSSSYAQGQCAYCDEHASEFCEKYFLASTVLLKTTHMPPAIAWRMARVLGEVLKQHLPGTAPAACSIADARKHVRRLRASAMLAPLRKARAWFSATSALLRYLFWRFSQDLRLRAFTDYWERIAHLERVRYVANHGGGFLRRHTVREGETLAGALHGAYGMHPLETHEGTCFRWTSPAAAIPFAIEAGDYDVTVQIAPFRGSPRNFPIGIFWNNHQVPRERIRVRASGLSFKVKRRECTTSALQQLTIIAFPIKPTAADKRLLGLPICSIRIEALTKNAAESAVSQNQSAPA